MGEVYGDHSGAAYPSVLFLSGRTGICPWWSGGGSVGSATANARRQSSPCRLHHDGHSEGNWPHRAGEGAGERPNPASATTRRGAAAAAAAPPLPQRPSSLRRGRRLWGLAAAGPPGRGGWGGGRQARRHPPAAGCRQPSPLPPAPRHAAADAAGRLAPRRRGRRRRALREAPPSPAAPYAVATPSLPCRRSLLPPPSSLFAQ